MTLCCTLMSRRCSLQFRKGRHQEVCTCAMAATRRGCSALHSMIDGRHLSFVQIGIYRLRKQAGAHRYPNNLVGGCFNRMREFQHFYQSVKAEPSSYQLNQLVLNLIVSGCHDLSVGKLCDWQANPNRMKGNAASYFFINEIMDSPCSFLASTSDSELLSDKSEPLPTSGISYFRKSMRCQPLCVMWLSVGSRKQPVSAHAMKVLKS